MNITAALPGIDPINGDKSPVASSGKELGKEDFLNLLVTQLKHQDPLNPSDPTEFTGQLAQFSSLEQLYNINESLLSMDALSGEVGRLSALSLIDRSVVIEDNLFKLDGEPVNLGFSFKDPVQSVMLYIRDESGRVVDQVELKDPGAEENWVQWDGKDASGQALPPGKYTFSAVAQGPEGKEVQGLTFVESRVIGVDFSGSALTLLTENGPIDLSEVTRVSSMVETVKEEKDEKGSGQEIDTAGR
ncbi:MAG: flagellar hook assembly protein FlgD [Deltaproteobacteria bacterium]|nr:flagellar hook assembly protein FlgD [Deltaproteobacteria bacterium]